jgi:ribonuclease Z
VAVDLSANISAVVDADVDAVILTHEHIDHVYGLPSLLHQLWLAGRERALDIYIPSGMEDLVNGLINLFSIREKKNIFPIRVLAETEFSVGSMKLTAFATDHTGTSVGVAAKEGEEKLVYTCDTRPIREIPSCMAGADVLIHETSGLWKDEETLIKKGHSSGADAAALAEKLQVKALYLCHLPRGEAQKKEILKETKALFEHTYIGEIGREITLEG